MARKLDKHIYQKRDEVRLNFVQGGDGDIIDLNVIRHEPLSSLRRMLAENSPVCNREEFWTFMFDEMLVEDEATPMGLGMVDGDFLVLLSPTDVLRHSQWPTSVVGPTITKRKAKEISVGLNVLVGEAEGGLPLHGDGYPALCPAPECREQLANLQTALLPALNMTVDEVVTSGEAPDHRPDFSKVEKKLVEGQYMHAHQGLKDVEGILKRYKQGTAIINNTLLGLGERANEAMKRELFYNKIAGTMAEFYKAIEVPVCKEQDESDAVYYVGPARNCTALNYLSCPPTVQLRGVSSETMVDELVEAWNMYVKSDTHCPYLGAVSYANVRYGLAEDVKVGAVVCPGLKKHYLCLNIDHFQQEEDDRNIDQLLEFIQGDDRKEPEKKKKRKKKRKSEEVAGLEVEAAALDSEAEALEAHAEEAEDEGEKALEAQVDKESASKTNHQAKEKKDICHDGPKSYTVGGCKKKVKSKQGTEEELDQHIAKKEAMLEERRCYAESIIESKSKEMRLLITGFEEAEDFKAAKMKEVSDIDARVGELQSMRAQLLVECEAKDKVMSKLIKKRKKLEEFITSQITKYKSETSQLETDLKDLKLKQSKSNQNNISDISEVKTVKTPNLQLLDYIDHKIEVKENELECPVCLEVASVPIYMCDELHLICSTCRPKVSECPECRQPYPSRPRRHRYVEKIAEELEGLRGERAEIFGD